ncbi:proteasome regulatory particle base subunit, partial [Coemansia sp. RSA 2424]
NWSKFSATAALGVIHHGHVRHGFNLLQPYLPEGLSSVSPYSEGGAFFALGLIHACHGTDKVISYLRDALVLFSGPTAEILQHGACLGLGAAGMGSVNVEVSQALLSVLYTDSAIAGEAAALGLGMVMMGSNDDETLRDMLLYAKETEHEKIIRALAVGIGMIMFGCKQEADPLIERLLDEEDPLLRLGAVHAITMAYCGTGDNGAIRKLLHLAVSDVKDDVRRAAVTGLGFVLLRSPEQVPRMVELLSESFNPHVRAGAALALGIACAGSGSKAAVVILEPMLKDAVDFVVEAASVALAFILIQHNETYDPKVADVRKRYSALIEAKHGEGVTKFGACISQGIIDAGGRNVTIELTSGDGQLNMAACAGMLLFTQFWYWFPLAHFLALTFKPTALIAVNKDLRLPKLDATCLSRKALFAYPAAMVAPAVVAPTKVATAVLSTTAKARRGGAKKSEDAVMEVEPPVAEAAAPAVEGSGMDVDESSDAKGLLKKGRKGGAEPPFAVGNMTRLLPYQERF